MPTDRERWRHASLATRNHMIKRAKINAETALRMASPQDAEWYRHMLEERGLGDHASVIDHFYETTALPDRSTLAQLLMYPTATSVTHGKDELLPQAKSDRPEDRLFREPL